MSQPKIGTWNLCLGLANKKDLVTETLKRNEIIICGLQETEIENNFPENLLSCSGYTIELEMNNDKKRAGVYVRNDIQYKRRLDLEAANCHIVILDINIGYKLRIINIYRSFRPQGMLSVNELFEKQLGLIRNCMCENLMLIGDFNLDANKGLSNDYNYRIPMNALSELVLEHNLFQIVNFPTWSRTIKNEKKESLLDHIYVKNIACISATLFETPTFGDHLLVMASLKCKLTQANDLPSQSRSWKNYSSHEMNEKLTDECEISQ